MYLKILQYTFFFLLFPYVYLLALSDQSISSRYPTPLEKSNFSKLTCYSDLMSYLQKIDDLSPKIAIKMIGNSVEGRDIAAAMLHGENSFGSNRSSKPVVLIFAQQHGNEPSGKEAALILIRELALGSLHDILQYLDIIVVPQVNPDGAEKNKRRNSNDMDLNRNHLILSEPEAFALHSIFLKWMPEVTLDVHESNASKKAWFCNGYIKDAEQMFDCVSNLNIAPKIIKFSKNVFIPQVGKYIQQESFRFHRYIVGGPPNERRIRHSTTNINDGRQSMGIYNTFSFIFEGKRFADVVVNIERRTLGQVSGMTAFLKTIIKHRTEILDIVHTSRQQLLKNSNPVHVRMDYYPDSLQPIVNFPIFDLYSWQQTTMKLENYEPIVRVKKSIDLPLAYLFSPEESRLIKLLTRHHIEMHRLKENTKLKIESYTISNITSIEEEDKPGENVDVNIRSTIVTMKKGSIVIFLQQKAANLIPLMLEPQSSWSICTERSGRKYRFAEYLKKDKEYPVYRLMNAVQLDVKLLVTD